MTQTTKDHDDTDEAPRRRTRKSAGSASKANAKDAEPKPATTSETAAAAKPDDEARPQTERAEELIDQTGERLGRIAASVGSDLRRSLARAREEAEDIWAEAQELRRRG